jgi:hypothetical protein
VVYFVVSPISLVAFPWHSRAVKMPTQLHRVTAAQSSQGEHSATVRDQPDRQIMSAGPSDSTSSAPHQLDPAPREAGRPRVQPATWERWARTEGNSFYLLDVGETATALRGFGRGCCRIAMIPSAAVIFSLNVQGSGIARPREVKVTKPWLLTSYSRDTDGVVHYPGQDLRRFSLPKLPCDLNEGLTEWVQPSDAPSPSTPILDALDSVGIGPCPELHFITFRNNLNKIMEVSAEANACVQ